MTNPISPSVELQQESDWSRILMTLTLWNANRDMLASRLAERAPKVYYFVFNLQKTTQKHVEISTNWFFSMKFFKSQIVIYLLFGTNSKWPAAKC